MESINSNKNKKTTPIHNWHLENSAKLAEFGNFILPLWYANGVRNEHLSVLKSAGLFDTCHMSVLSLNGSDAMALLQKSFSKDLDRNKNKTCSLPIGRGCYGVFLKKNGHLIDDAIIYRLDENEFILCLNSDKDVSVLKHLKKLSDGLEVNIVNQTGKMVKIDLQGPASAHILSRIISMQDQIFTSFPYFSCKGKFHTTTCEQDIVTDSGIEILLCRSGYTGEFGFEIFTHKSKVESLWHEIIDKGQEFDLVPCGLAARDSLRTGAGLPLAGHDIGDWPFFNTPWDFALPIDADGNFSKTFTGSDSIKEWKKHTCPYVGFDPRKIEAGIYSKVLDENGVIIGTVLTCATDMATGRLDGKLISIKSLVPDITLKGISCGFVLLDYELPVGSKIILKDTRRSIEVEIVPDIRPDRTARLPISNFL